MPELPELEVVKEVLQRRVVGCAIESVQSIGGGSAIIVRSLAQQRLEEAVTGAQIAGINRRGKFLIFTLDPAVQDSRLFLALNPKLTGRLQLAQPTEKRMPKTHQIKGVLTRGEFIAGIGNAYADEILWAARLHPYRKRTALTGEEIDRLYAAMQSVLREAIEKVRVEMGDAIHREPRDFMAVHMKSGEPCPRCGTPISLVSANQRITNFCRTCQPGGLIKGM